MKYEIIVFVCLLCVHHLRADEEHHIENGKTHRDNVISEKNDSIIHECHQFNKDYREYIKCLKREKRQHHSSYFGNDKHACLDECLEIKCETSSCIHDCHNRCKKRLIETYSKTIETSLDCNGDSCHTIDRQLPNITLNVNLTNILPNITRNNCVKTNTGENCTDGGKIVNITNVINNVNQGSNCPYPGCNFYPYALAPQLPKITIDFNSGPIGGCSFPWSCIQQPQTVPIDCSMCTYPFARHQCNPLCTSDAQRNAPTNTQKSNSQTLSNNYNRNNY